MESLARITRRPDPGVEYKKKKVSPFCSPASLTNHDAQKVIPPDVFPLLFKILDTQSDAEAAVLH